MNFFVYFVVGIAGIAVFNWLSKKTFKWETIIRYLWKQIHQLGYWMSIEISSGQNEIIFIERYRKQMSLRGNIINSILDFVNYLREEEEEDEDIEEETFGYGRFDFDSLLVDIRNNPDYFKKFK